MKDKTRQSDALSEKPAQRASFSDKNPEFSQKDNQGMINSGMGANAVESLVFGSATDEKEDALLLEIEQAEAQKKAQSSCELDEIVEFKYVPECLVFSASTTYKLFRRSTKREYFINGKMLEARIGLDNALYEKVKSRAACAFCIGDYIAVFVSARRP